MDLPPSASSPLRGRRSRFGFQYRVSADWITQCPLSVWVDAPTVGPDIEAIGLPGVRHATPSYTVRLQLPSVTTVGYRDSLSYACSSPSGHPSSRFAVRYVHEFCLMLLPDAPSLRLPLPCWCSPSVRSRWLSFLQLACHARHTSGTARSAGGGSNVKVVFRDFQLRENDRFVVRAVGTVRTPEVFQGPVEIIKKKPPKATDSPDFHRPGSFHSPRRPLKLKRAPVHAGALDLSHQLFSYGVEPNVYRSE